MTYNTTLLECLMRVRNDPGLGPLRDWLVARRETARTGMELLLDPQQIARAQGRAVELKEIIELIQTAPALLEKARTGVTTRPDFVTSSRP